MEGGPDPVVGAGIGVTPPPGVRTLTPLESHALAVGWGETRRNLETMKTLASLMLVCCGTLAACNNTQESAYEVEDAQTVTLDISGMT